MKILAQLLGPLLRRTKNHPQRSAVCVFVLFELVGLNVIAAYVYHAVTGWTKVVGVVVNAGWTASGNNGANTISQVKYMWQGRSRLDSTSLDWTLRNGAHLPVWVRGNDAIFSYPPVQSWAIIGTFCAATVLAIIAVIVGASLQSVIADYDYEVEVAERLRLKNLAIAEDVDLPAPQTTSEIVALMERYGDVEVTREYAMELDANGNRLCCERGIDDFLDRHFPRDLHGQRRNELNLLELMPYVRHTYDEVWAYIVQVVLKMLGDIGVIQRYAEYHVIVTEYVTADYARA